MNEEISDFSDPNYQDYTTATDWEVFIARIEEIIRDFHIPALQTLPGEDVFKSCSWKVATESLRHGDINFILSHYSLKSQNETQTDKFTPILGDVWDNGLKFLGEIDKDSVEAPVGVWYGLREFLVLVPGVEIFSESRIKSYLSSITVALANVKCKIPVFLKIRSDWQYYYVGLLEYDGLRTRFDTIHLGKVPHQCYHLSGILDMFKAKLASPVPIELLEISSKFSFKIEMDLIRWKTQYPVDFLDLKENLIDISSNGVLLPCGAVVDPIRALTLHVTWPKLSEDAVMDNASYSDFDSLTAPMWSVDVSFRDNIDGILPQFINDFVHLLQNDEILMDQLPSDLRGNNRMSAPEHKANNTEFEFIPLIPDEMVQSIMYFLFPDATNGSQHEYDSDKINNAKNQENLGGFNPVAGEFLKIGPEDGLVWRFSLVAAWIYATSGIIALSQLWREFTEELRFRWDHRRLIPGVADGQPSPRTCLLHQKLQLLNCCIKRAEERAPQSSDEEEFFDCDEEAKEGQETGEGRACRLGSALLASGAPLFVPLTQQPAPRTDDDVRADASLLAALAADAAPDAASLRARIQAASLTSDMQAFKAANPGALFADFVRWYSPRDWSAGELSERMLLPANAWLQAWAAARALPAARQRRLFDERREAERTLHFLRSQTVARAAELLLPSVLRCGMKQLGLRELQIMHTYLDSDSNGRAIWEAVTKELTEKETIKAREDRLKTLIATLESDYADSETANPGEVRVGANARAKVWKSVANSQPLARQFCIRAQVMHRSRTIPQMLRAVLKPNEIRLLAVLSDDVVFLS